jgi:hypothetical protein
MYILAANSAGATSNNVLCMMYGPRVQFGDWDADRQRPMYPINST